MKPIALLLAVTFLATAQEKPLIRLIATGGTIAHVRAGYTPDTRITGHELLQSIPQLGAFARIDVEEFSKIGSGDFSTAMLVSPPSASMPSFRKSRTSARSSFPSAPIRSRKSRIFSISR